MDGAVRTATQVVEDVLDLARMYVTQYVSDAGERERVRKTAHLASGTAPAVTRAWIGADMSRLRTEPDHEYHRPQRPGGWHSPDSLARSLAAWL